MPEALAVITEYDNFENPDYILEELDKARKNSDFIAAKVFLIDLDRSGEEQIMNHLVNGTKISGKVIT